ncbi:MAG TPA: thermonuclease family protein [bacterium]|nr:thermonuclease family protein [bacterium]
MRPHPAWPALQWGLLTLALACTLALALEARAPAAPAPRPGFRTVVLEAGVRTVWDGDTFDADLNGDGRLSLPRERVRLLFVDTPELHESHKGEDRAHGLPARAFLEAALRRRPIVLYVPMERPSGNYGRTLALVMAGGENVNLALIRAGHSYFDTRFRFPADYAAYAAAEGTAFDARRGIWRDAPSRKHYLERLQRELKTPAGRTNPRFVPGLREVASLRPQTLVGKYVRMAGVLADVRALRKNVRLLHLRGAPHGEPLAVVAYPRMAERLHVDAWAVGARVRVEGFLQTYRGRPELVLHYGAPAP